VAPYDLLIHRVAFWLAARDPDCLSNAAWLQHAMLSATAWQENLLSAFFHTIDEPRTQRCKSLFRGLHRGACCFASFCPS
jgi:hypothetical protein